VKIIDTEMIIKPFWAESVGSGEIEAGGKK
jgi:hypothetical protein